jgi:hypothetical protein
MDQMGMRYQQGREYVHAKTQTHTHDEKTNPTRHPQPKLRIASHT